MEKERRIKRDQTRRGRYTEIEKRQGERELAPAGRSAAAAAVMATRGSTPPAGAMRPMIRASDSDDAGAEVVQVEGFMGPR